jgi:hypothetical protein
MSRKSKRLGPLVTSVKAGLRDDPGQMLEAAT